MRLWWHVCYNGVIRFLNLEWDYCDVCEITQKEAMAQRAKYREKPPKKRLVPDGEDE